MGFSGVDENKIALEPRLKNSTLDSNALAERGGHLKNLVGFQRYPSFEEAAQKGA